MEDFASARAKMIDSQVRTEDVTDYAVLAAMSEVPRERFVPREMRTLAYIDRDIRLTPASGGTPARYLMEPAPFARLLQLAEIRSTDIVLEIGCGSGYSTAVLARVANSVVAVEEDADLAAKASETLVELDIANAAVVTAPLEKGCVEEGPYDVIFVSGSVESLPDGLLEQLKEGGRLVAVIGHGRAAAAKLFTRTGGEIGSRTAFNVDVPPLPGFERPKAFTF